MDKKFPWTRDCIALVSDDGEPRGFTLCKQLLTDVSISRICPGRHLAELTLYTTIITMLSTVNILKPFDKDGMEYMPKVEFDGSTVR